MVLYFIRYAYILHSRNVNIICIFTYIPATLLAYCARNSIMQFSKISDEDIVRTSFNTLAKSRSQLGINSVSHFHN